MDQKSRTLYIRADANEIIGTGHVMRCLSIAEAVCGAGGEVVFLAADSRAQRLVEERGFEAVCLHSVWNDLEQELEQLVSVILQKKISILLVDSYYVMPHYLKTLGRYTRLAYIDDLSAFSYPVDLLIRYAIYSEKNGGRREPSVLEGCAYVPLKHQFDSLPEREISVHAKRILVLTGGTDPCHVALKIGKHVADTARYRGLCFDIVCGRYNPDLKELQHLAADTEELSIYHNVEQMAELMLLADMAVTASGTTLYELCACGTPSVCYVLADNQIQNAQAFAEKGLMLYGGDVRQEHWLPELFCQVDRLLMDAPLRRKMAEGMQRLVDGKGAWRIADAILKL